MPSLEIIDNKLIKKELTLEEIFNYEPLETHHNIEVKKVTKEDFEKFLTEYCDWIILNDIKGWNEKLINEYVYGIILKGTDKKFVMYSSIDVRTNKFRDTGCDAIRILKYGSRINSHHIRVNRTNRWANNLAMKLHDFRISNKY